MAGDRSSKCTYSELLPKFKKKFVKAYNQQKTRLFLSDEPDLLNEMNDLEEWGRRSDVTIPEETYPLERKKEVKKSDEVKRKDDSSQKITQFLSDKLKGLEGKELEFLSDNAEECWNKLEEKEREELYNNCKAPKRQ